MPLELLRFSPHIYIYYDSCNDWLFMDWQGELDLDAAQTACLELAYTCLMRPYRRVLVSTTQLTHVAWEVPTWLSNEFLPYLVLAGVEQLAFVSGRSARNRDMLQELVNRLPPLPVIVFDDLEMAVDWLKRTRPSHSGSWQQRLPATEAQLHQAVLGLMQLVNSRQAQLA